jgi:hypothetical protein
MNKGRMEQLGQIQWKYSGPTAASAVTLSLRHATGLGCFSLRLPLKRHPESL